MPMLSSMEYRKTLLYISGLILATGGPITLFSASDLLAGMKRSWFASSAAATAAPSHPPGSSTSSPTPELSAGPSAPSVSMRPLSAAGTWADTVPSPSLAEVLNFNVTVDWVLGRWPRVSTGLPYLQLQGYRVPLVTGTGTADVAGSLTYYFNAQQQVQRITLRGTTGDPGVLVALLTGHFRFARRLTNDPGIVLYEAVDPNNQSVGSLKLRSARVIKANQPYTRFEVDLVMDRTG